MLPRVEKEWAERKVQLGNVNISRLKTDQPVTDAASPSVRLFHILTLACFNTFGLRVCVGARLSSCQN